ncbi:hypothetical protein RGJ33_003658 [Acinetobacter baumannii]|nr:hypothetical protein [Acinetobacter baumannii]EKV4015241.1 hypothetical protein [Acinetobacter baumannii]EKV5853945.1 hypothetical protein [Acinetobacter baumannii]EKV6827470.1 hypothetical protein [Acinetobacter baumannii]EKV7287288.1 hypothetical protein [Acinetobacter baumannii]
MKPEQFIRWFGIEDAKYLIEQNINCNDFEFSLDDLKRLVESVDLVDSLGGLKAARSEAHKDCFVYNQPLLAAIAAYESIYGGGHES